MFFYHVFQVIAERFAEVFAAQGEFDRSFEEAELVAEIVALAFEIVGVNGIELRENFEGVRQLDFAALARFRVFEDVKYLRLDDVAAEHGETTRGVFEIRLLDHVMHAHEARIAGLLLTRNDAIRRNLFVRHLLAAEHGAARLFVDVDELLERWLFGMIDDIVAEQHGKRLVAHERLRAKNGIPGIKFISAAPAIVRPTSFNKTALDSITVASTAGGSAGETDVAVSGYTLGAGEKYVYKIASAAAPAVHLGEVLEIGTNKWTVGTFPLDDLTATTGHYITVAAVDSIGAAVAEGHTTITSKA